MHKDEKIALWVIVAVVAATALVVGLVLGLKPKSPPTPPPPPPPENKCPTSNGNVCNGHGTCVPPATTCDCVTGWSGSGCTTGPTPGGNSKWACGSGQACTESTMGADSRASCETSCVSDSGAWPPLAASLNATKTDFTNTLLQTRTPDFTWTQSLFYTFEGFIEALETMVVTGVGGQHFYSGDTTSTNGLKYGLVNVAVFMAQCMAETIIFDACDENNWSMAPANTTDPKIQGFDPSTGSLVNYPITAACGQAGQSYQDYTCAPEEAEMQCPVDPAMKSKGFTHAAWYGAPPPLFCAPVADTGGTLGNWEDQLGWCGNVGKHGITDVDEYVKYMRAGETCRAYDNQKAGASNVSRPIMNMKPDETAPGAGSYKKPRSDVEGCCWWGRGVIQTSGPCNIGKLNYYLGKGASDRHAPSLYPSIDFCKTPEAICDPAQPVAIKWIAGMFYWVNAVQSYDRKDWNYLTELKKFVDDGGLDTLEAPSDSGFIHAVSGIVNRGCHDPPCGTGELLVGGDRATYFCRALKVFGLRRSSAAACSTG